MFLAIARKLYLENIRDIPLRQSGTSRYSTEIAEAFITVLNAPHYNFLKYLLFSKCANYPSREKPVLPEGVTTWRL